MAGTRCTLGVGVGANGGERGNVLRWTGSRSDPFAFAVVATLPAQAADLTVTVFVTTWPGSDAELAGPAAGAAPPPPSIAGVWMSPLLASGAPGLNPEDADGWTAGVERAAYEPDPVVPARTAWAASPRTAASSTGARCTCR